MALVPNIPISVTTALVPSNPILATVVELPSNPISVALGERVVNVLVAVVPSCISASRAISVVTVAMSVASVCVGPASALPVVALKARYLPFRASFNGNVKVEVASSSASLSERAILSSRVCCTAVTLSSSVFKEST